MEKKTYDAAFKLEAIPGGKAGKKNLRRWQKSLGSPAKLTPPRKTSVKESANESASMLRLKWATSGFVKTKRLSIRISAAVLVLLLSPAPAENLFLIKNAPVKYISDTKLAQIRYYLIVHM